MKRWLAKLLAFLLLGAIVNIAVAWGCALTSDAPHASFRNPGAGIGRIYLRATTVPHENYRYVDEGEEDSLRRAQMIPSDVAEDLAVDEYMSIGCFQSWYMPRYENAELQGPPWHFAVRIVCGWPLHCLEGTTAPTHAGWEFGFASGAPKESWGLRVDRMSRPWPDNVLPFRPIWPGFAINTVFYAGVLWLLFAAPFALRRRRRIKRGLCPKCAYPVGASDVCTECGKPVTAAKAT